MSDPQTESEIPETGPAHSELGEPLVENTEKKLQYKSEGVFMLRDLCHTTHLFR